MIQDIVIDKLMSGTRPGRLALMYHSIESPGVKSSGRWSVSNAAFLSQLDLLNHLGWRTECISQLGEMSSDTVKIPIVFITFDDGYADNWLAFEALQQRKMRASFFIISQAIGKWALEMGRLVQPKKQMLGVSQLKSMKENGMEIGSHGVAHRVLKGLDKQTLKSELVDSKASLERLLGADVTSLAYPYGAYDEAAILAARSAGYSFACTCRAGWMQPKDNPMEIRRIEITGNDSLIDFALKLKFGLSTDPKQTLMRYYLGRLGLRTWR